MAGTAGPITANEAFEKHFHLIELNQLKNKFPIQVIRFDPVNYGVVGFGLPEDDKEVALHHRSCAMRSHGTTCTCPGVEHE